MSVGQVWALVVLLFFGYNRGVHAPRLPSRAIVVSALAIDPKRRVLLDAREIGCILGCDRKTVLRNKELQAIALKFGHRTKRWSIEDFEAWLATKRPLDRRGTAYANQGEPERVVQVPPEVRAVGSNPRQWRKGRMVAS